MAEPTSKLSRMRRGNRRSHDALTKPAVANCPNCGAMIRPHRACTECGQYKGRDYLTPKS